MRKPTPEPSFNAWTGGWLPLIEPGGSTVWASPVEVLTGQRDATELDYPRDDFRVFARLLLSAMVQAVFPARDNDDLRRRLDKPMKRAEVDERLKSVLADFALFGNKPFLQGPPPVRLPDKGAAPFVFPSEDLFCSRTKVDELSIPVALVALFIEHTYAGGAGRGYSPGPGGQPGVLTLVTPPSIRQGAWANSVTRDFAATLYAKDDARPWSYAPRGLRARASVGLVGGLFYQPRTVWLIPVAEGLCSFTGLLGPRVRMSPLCLGASPLAKKSAKAEDLWQHPCAPLAVNSVGIAPLRLKADRPVWTGLAQLLQPISRSNQRKEHPREGPAPVLEQWNELPLRPKRTRMLVLDFNRDKANIKGRFFESFTLSEGLLGRPEAIERVRALVDDAEGAADLLRQSLDAAHDERKHGGFARADAQASLWSSTEGAVLDWLGAMGGSEEGEETVVEATESRIRESFRRTAMKLFDRHVEVSEFDPRKQKLIARARRRLRQRLWATVAVAPPSGKRTQGGKGTLDSMRNSADMLPTELRAVRQRFDQLQPGAKTRLRRCHTASELIFERAYPQVAGLLVEEAHLPHVVFLFPLAGHRNLSRFSFGQYVRRWVGDDEGAAMRVRRLLASRDREELDHRLSGLLRRADGAHHPVDWGALGLDVLMFFAQGDAVRRRWAEDFHAPSDLLEPTQSLNPLGPEG